MEGGVDECESLADFPDISWSTKIEEIERDNPSSEPRTRGRRVPDHRLLDEQFRMIAEVAVAEHRNGQQVGFCDLMKGRGSFTMLSSGIWGLESALRQPFSTYSFTYFPQSRMPSFRGEPGDPSLRYEMESRDEGVRPSYPSAVDLRRFFQNLES